MDAEKIRQVMLFECFAGPVAWQQTGRIEPAVDLGVDPLAVGQGDQDPFARVFIAFKLVQSSHRVFVQLHPENALDAGADRRYSARIGPAPDRVP